MIETIDTLDLIILISIGWLLVSCVISTLAYHQGMREGRELERRHYRLGRAGNREAR
jgi:hypothetical protein